MKTKAKPEPQKSTFVMVTFGRGSAELKRQFDLIAKKGGYTKAGLAMALIREGIERRISVVESKPE